MGVPAIALGWAHKYDLLMENFGVSRYVHCATEDPHHLLHLIDELLDRSNGICSQLLERRQKFSEKLDHMWEEVRERVNIRETRP